MPSTTRCCGCALGRCKSLYLVTSVFRLPTVSLVGCPPFHSTTATAAGFSLLANLSIHDVFSLLGCSFFPRLVVPRPAALRSYRKCLRVSTWSSATSWCTVPSGRSSAGPSTRWTSWSRKPPQRRAASSAAGGWLALGEKRRPFLSCGKNAVGRHASTMRVAHAARYAHASNKRHVHRRPTPPAGAGEGGRPPDGRHRRSGRRQPSVGPVRGPPRPGWAPRRRWMRRPGRRPVAPRRRPPSSRRRRRGRRRWRRRRRRRPLSCSFRRDGRGNRVGEDRRREGPAVAAASTTAAATVAIVAAAAPPPGRCQPAVAGGGGGGCGSGCTGDVATGAAPIGHTVCLALPSDCDRTLLFSPLRPRTHHLIHAHPLAVVHPKVLPRDAPPPPHVHTHRAGRRPPPRKAQ